MQDREPDDARWPSAQKKARRLAFSADCTPTAAAARAASTLVGLPAAAAVRWARCLAPVPPPPAAPSAPTPSRASATVTRIGPEIERVQGQELAARPHERDHEREDRRLEDEAIQGSAREVAIREVSRGVDPADHVPVHHEDHPEKHEDLDLVRAQEVGWCPPGSTVRKRIPLRPSGEEVVRAERSRVPGRHRA